MAFFKMLARHGQTRRFDHAFVGGAISNAIDAKILPRKKRYEAACPLAAITICHP